MTFLWRAEGEPEPTSAANPFKDVSAKTCTRGQVVTFLYRDVVGE